MTDQSTTELLALLEASNRLRKVDGRWVAPKPGRPAKSNDLYRLVLARWESYRSKNPGDARIVAPNFIAGNRGWISQLNLRIANDRVLWNSLRRGRRARAQARHLRRASWRQRLIPDLSLGRAKGLVERTPLTELNFYMGCKALGVEPMHFNYPRFICASFG